VNISKQYDFSKKILVIEGVFMFHPNFHTYSGLMYVWQTKIAFFALVKDPVVIVIESPEIAEMQRALFYNLWDMLQGR
jgi:hypothetical protein